MCMLAYSCSLSRMLAYSIFSRMFADMSILYRECLPIGLFFIPLSATGKTSTERNITKQYITKQYVTKQYITKIHNKTIHNKTIHYKTIHNKTIHDKTIPFENVGS